MVCDQSIVLTQTDVAISDLNGIDCILLTILHTN